MTGFLWTDAEVRRALGLRSDLADPDARFSGISTDSRTTEPGDLYVALVGERFDGHDFVAQAFARGAAAAVVCRPSPGDDAGPLYPVRDTLVALGKLAAHRRVALSAPVVAITGSSGKTTTKEMTAAALSESLRVHATRGNRNNRIGMPLTLLDAPVDAEAVVLELGTNEPGEIRALAQVARPDIAVITTVGESHLEKLGSIDGVLEEKLDLLRDLAEGGRCVVGDEPPRLAERARALCPEVRVAGWTERADEDLRPADAEVDVFGAYTFHWRGHDVVTPMAGRHGATDALLALAVADLLGVAPRDAVRGLGAAAIGSMRGEVRSIGGLTVIVDCYNANPQSVRAALDVLAGHAAATRRVAVLGTMLELGASTEALHREVLDDALARDIDLVVATGAFGRVARAVADARRERLVAADGWREAYPELKRRLDGDEVVLLKASRGVALEGIVAQLEADFLHRPAAGAVDA